MKLNDAICRTMKLKPDIYSDEILTGWLSDLDGKLCTELLRIEPVQYRFPADANRELLVPPPYDELYELYLIAMIDFHNREAESYTNDMQLFNAAMNEYRAWYRRNHVPPSSGNHQI